VLLLVALVGGGAIAVFLARSISRGAGEMLRAAEGIAEGDVEQTVNVRTKDEIGDTASTFGRMVEYLRGIAGAADSVAAGDLTVQVEPKSERDALGRSFASMTESLRDLVGQVDTTASSLGSASRQMASTSVGPLEADRRHPRHDHRHRRADQPAGAQRRDRRRSPRSRSEVCRRAPC
jgi:methyl-accepting chemotaxis protein